MAASTGLQEFPVIGRLISGMKRLAGAPSGSPHLRAMDDRQIGEIAHEFGLSRAELFMLCANKSSGGLLKQRLAEFGLTEELLARKHPHVLQDLQRVCGSCAVASRCARDFATRSDSGRDEYCPNTCTLHALTEEGIDRNESSCCGSCGS